MKIKVTPDLCCGTGMCAKIAPKVYQLDDLGYNCSNGKDVPEGQDELARRGAKICPEAAIELVE